MKRKLLVSIVIHQVVSITCYGLASDPINNYKDYIENEQVISENKWPTHASFTSFTSKDKELSNKAQYVKSLAGVWKFNWVKSPKDSPRTFMDPNTDITN